MLINKGRVFRDLMLHPIIESVMGHLLGPDFLVSSFTANIAHPGGDPMALHTDQGYVGFWTPRPVVANIAWMLDDFTEENGGTRLVPASHLNQAATPRSSVYVPSEPARPPTPDDTIAAEGPAGSILCFDGRVWHGTGANRTDRPRHALLSYHCRPFIRQQENFALGLDPAIRAGERPALLDRLGFATWAGLGRVESPRPATPLFIAPGAVGPLAPDGTLLQQDLS
jgi:ectoine hydroxylase-related dioxygenase (phytanoyl-CoA dioxygenase family)